jgi:hypothetical protein
MAHSLNDLSALQDVALDDGNVASLDDLKETGSYLPMLQPGAYEFETPADMNLPWDTVEKEGQPQRVQVQFDDEHALKIIAGPDAKRVGEPYTTRVSNVPRERKFGGETIKINDFQYLLKKLGEKTVPKTNREYLLALQKYAGRRFRSAINVSWSCNPNRDVRMWQPDPDPAKAGAGAGTRVEVAGQKGCGGRYYPDGKTNGVPKGADGLYPEEIICPKCHALLRGFSNLDLVREA